MKTRAVTPPEDKKKRHYHYHTEATETSLRDQTQIDGGLWKGVRNKHHLQGKVEEKFVEADDRGEISRGGERGGAGEIKGQLRGR